jgi:hypothetical protein
MIGVLAMGLAVPMQAEANDYDFFWGSTLKDTSVKFEVKSLEDLLGRVLKLNPVVLFQQYNN